MFPYLHWVQNSCFWFLVICLDSIIDLKHFQKEWIVFLFYSFTAACPDATLGPWQIVLKTAFSLLLQTPPIKLRAVDPEPESEGSSVAARGSQTSSTPPSSEPCIQAHFKIAVYDLNLERDSTRERLNNRLLHPRCLVRSGLVFLPCRAPHKTYRFALQLGDDITTFLYGVSWKTAEHNSRFT